MKLIETLAWPWGIVGILWLFFPMSITARVVVVVCIVLLIVMCIVWAIGNSEPMSEEERDAIIRDAKYMVDYRTKERLRKEEMERRYRMAKVVAYMMEHGVQFDIPENQEEYKDKKNARQNYRKQLPIDDADFYEEYDDDDDDIIFDEKGNPILI